MKQVRSALAHRQPDQQRISRRSDMLAAVLQITGQIAGILDLEPLLDQIAQPDQGALLGYREVALLLLEDGNMLVVSCLCR